MHASRIARLVRSGTTLIFWLMLAGALAPVQAAELGEAHVRSYIGQPLVADVELTALAEPGASVQVRLADADVWRGANVRMHPVLSNLTLSVMRRDGRQFLHITSVKPVEGDYVHLFLTLGEGGKREVRAVTLWLSHDSQPQPPSAPVPVAVPLPVPAAAPVPLPAAPMRAEPAKPATPTPMPTPTPAPRPVRVLQLPSAAPLSCPQISEDQLKTCADLDRKNGVLSARIVELEEKVKLLQRAIEGKSAAAGHASASASHPAAAAGHDAASASHDAASASHGAASASHGAASASHEAASAAHAAEPAVPPPILSRAALAKKNGAAKKGDEFPWVLIGAAVGATLATALAVWFLLRRRKRKAALPADAGAAAEPSAAVKSGMFAKLAARFKRKPKAPAPVAHVEPDAS
ncbi:MAG TPA: hypothetical protein VF800_23170 [Telluria sp.]|jgi:pilus assembly protein FimV